MNLNQFQLNLQENWVKIFGGYSPSDFKAH